MRWSRPGGISPGCRPASIGCWPGWPPSRWCRPVGELDKEWVREEVACALRLSSGHAADLLAQASELARLPATLELFERGLIGEHHARSLAEATMALDDAAAAAVEKAVLGKAPDQRLAEFRRAIRRAVLTVAPKPAEQRHQEALAQRRVVRTPGPRTG